jgi:hypothetical protein
MNADKLTTGGNPERLRQAAYRVITRTQDEPDVQLKGMALALVATCRAVDVDIRQLLVSCERMVDDLDGPYTAQFRALEAYAREEIGR